MSKTECEVYLLQAHNVLSKAERRISNGIATHHTLTTPQQISIGKYLIEARYGAEELRRQLSTAQATIDKADKIQAKYTLLIDRVAQLETVVDKLPRCWRLVDGKLVQDAIVLGGDEVWFYGPDDQLLHSIVWGVELWGPELRFYFGKNAVKERMEPGLCYKTKAAAEAAKAGKGDGQ